ncbi:MAG: GNAT family N-acetyltransferase [Terracidiphilus sp.]
MVTTRPESITIRVAKTADADDISRVILDSLHFTNAVDYSPEIISRVAKKFSPACVENLIAKRRVLVALMNARIVGTASLDGNVIQTVFVAPDAQRRGVGRSLMCEIDRIALDIGLHMLTVPSSITAETFYAKLGFVGVRDNYDGEERTIIMERRL